ncbi:MAG: exosortase/archaeosortase family protein [Fimbriimonadaceae bacterium]|nr:exosortase/archaeosortase family protein [Fimbriimonadaceae bacterium]
MGEQSAVDTVADEMAVKSANVVVGTKARHEQFGVGSITELPTEQDANTYLVNFGGDVGIQRVAESELKLEADGAADEDAKMDYAELARKISQSPAFVPGVLLALGIGVMFFTVIRRLYGLWTSEDGYYSHGFLVPLISGYVVYRWWPKLKTIPVKPFYPAAVLLVALVAGTLVANSLTIIGLLSLLLLLTLVCSVWMLAGFRWALWLSPPILYLAFGLPLLSSIITNYTNPLQLASTSVAIQLLKVFGLNTFQVPNEPTTVWLDNFMLDIAVPCSGLKLVLALMAFTAFFVMIARLKWWANLVMVAMILPLAVFINGLRISLIGVVGNAYGSKAGMQFHDYSGYITLIVCFLILFQLARGLGWKN